MIYYVIAKESGYLSEKPKGFLGILSDYSTEYLLDHSIRQQQRVDELYVVRGDTPGAALVNYWNDVYFSLDISKQGKLNIEILHDFKDLLNHVFKIVDQRMEKPFQMNSGSEKTMSDLEIGYTTKENWRGPVHHIKHGFETFHHDLLRQLDTAMASEIKVERKKYKFKLVNN